MFKKFIGLIVIVIAFSSTSANAALITSTVGDADCFGLGGVCADGDLWRDDLGGDFFNDYRDAGDLATANHTDSWDSPTNPTWVHSYSLGGETPVSAFFDLIIAGFADIGSVDLLADNITIATYNFPNQFQTVHELTAAVPLNLVDGSTSFSLSSGGGDGFIIDSSTFRIETSVRNPSASVPEPVSIALIGLGLVGVGMSRKKIKC